MGILELKRKAFCLIRVALRLPVCCVEWPPGSRCGSGSGNFEHFWEEAMKLHKTVLAASLAAGVWGAGFPAHAGGDKIAFPTGFEKGTLYSVLDRHDNKQYRELYASPGVVD